MTEPVLPANRTITDEKRPDDDNASKTVPSENDKILGEALKMEQAIQNAAQPQERKDESLKFSY